MTQAFNLSQFANSINSSGKADLTSAVTGVLPLVNGGTGTSSPSLVAGTNVSITGTFPNQTINATSSSGGIRGQLFTASGTFTVPSGVTSLKVTAVGGGGGGGAGTAGNPITGGGGGGGAVCVGYVTVTSGASVAVTVGQGGTGGTFGTITAPSGGNTIVGGITARGGGGGGEYAPALGHSGAAGGAAGTATGGIWNLTSTAGNNGDDFTVNPSTAGAGGGGIATYYLYQFIYGTRTSLAGSGTGTNGTGYGGGGTGGSGSGVGYNPAGGNGTAGFVWIEW
jgi:hypothetical protein